jgi:hypothetical protein
MAEITVASSEFEESYVAQNQATTNFVTSQTLTFGQTGGSNYNLLVTLNLAKRPRFIPNLGNPEGFVGQVGYTSESAFSTSTAYFVNSGLGFINQIDPSLDLQDLGAVTYNKVSSSPNVDWTTAGALNDIVDEPAIDFTFNQTSANQDFDLPITGRYARRAMFGLVTLIYYNNDADDIVAIFASQETSGSEAEVILRGRYATRNRENPVRSRKFGVR